MHEHQYKYNGSILALVRIFAVIFTSSLLHKVLIQMLPNATFPMFLYPRLIPKANSAFHPSGVGKWVPALTGKGKAGMVHSVSRCTWGVQVKLWDPLRTRATPERLRVVHDKALYKSTFTFTFTFTPSSACEKVGTYAPSVPLWRCPCWQSAVIWGDESPGLEVMRGVTQWRPYTRGRHRSNEDTGSALPIALLRQ